ncbi:MAG: hypothetical protein Q4P66_01425 [Actinomycetaceae bacterium]|nr:hypothetical protein [Actinomycetaceae bacterium]
MPMSHRQPRRPAMLDPKRAIAIQGDDDPAQQVGLAHSTAQMLIGTTGSEKERHLLKTAIVRQGIDIVSELWSRCPATTLPGMFWRLYLLYQWYVRDPSTVAQRYQEGLDSPIILGIPKGSAISLKDFFNDVDTLLHASWEGDVTTLFAQAAVICRILASGATFGSSWIITDEDELADQVTRRARALLATADEFEQAARLNNSNRLD